MNTRLSRIAVALLILGSTSVTPLEALDPAMVPTGTCASTITQSSSQTVAQGTSISCLHNGTVYSTNTSFWRAFDMAAFAGSQQYNVTSVSFGIEYAQAGGGASSQPITVRLYRNNGLPFPGGSGTLIGSTDITVQNQTRTIVSVPLIATVPAGVSELVMEVFVPDGQTDQNVFFIGSNAEAETGPSYISATGCQEPSPVTIASLGFPNMHLIFDVHGSCSSGAQTPASALNISTRLRVGQGENVLIGGFILTNASSSLVLRGIGPSLTQFGIPDALPDPFLELRGSNGATLNQNDDWQDDPTQAALISAAGLALQDPLESGIAAKLQPGNYTVLLAGINQGEGVGLVELYNTNSASGAQLGNISTRGLVQTGTNVMIGGFILGGSSGNARIAVRGIGPSLGQIGVGNPLADPTLELRDNNGTTLAANDDWHDDAESAAQLIANGLALQNDLEAGIFITLPPGTFTAVLAGLNGAGGVGLVEVYNLQ
jgi:hypothetical protein